MDKKFLVDHDIAVGRALLRQLDEHNIAIDAALWLLDPEAEQWRLVLATPLLKKLGRRETYKRLQPVLKEFLERSDLGVDDVTVVSPQDPLIQGLARTVSTPGSPSVSSIRLTGNIIDGRLIPDAHVYRAHLRRRGSADRPPQTG